MNFTDKLTATPDGKSARAEGRQAFADFIAERISYTQAMDCGAALDYSLHTAFIDGWNSREREHLRSLEQPSMAERQAAMEDARRVLTAVGAHAFAAAVFVAMVGMGISVSD